MFTTLIASLDLDKTTQTRLELLLRRDTKVIKKILGILNYEEKNIYSSKKNKYRDTVRYRTTRVKLEEVMVSSSHRPVVKHDLKKLFPRISHNELVECIGTANAMYLSYLEARQIMTAAVPSVRPGNLIGRTIYLRRAKVDFENHTIGLVDSYDTNLDVVSGRKKKVVHDRLQLKFLPYKRLLEYSTTGKLRAIRITKDNGRFYVHFIFELKPKRQDLSHKQLAILGIDLGINKLVTTSLLTHSGIAETKIFHDQERREKYLELEEKTNQRQYQASLRDRRRYRKRLNILKRKCNDYATRTQIRHILYLLKHGKDPLLLVRQLLSTVSHGNHHYLRQILQQLAKYYPEFDQYQTRKIYLSRMRRKRKNLRDDYLKQLTFVMAEYIEELTSSFNIYVSIGTLKGIRRRARRGNGNKSLRKLVNSWPYKKLTDLLRHQLEKRGLGDRLIVVNEAYTSSKCWRCNKRGSRPNQEIFHCRNYHCPIKKINADINGATNIAKRGIKYGRLVNNKNYPKYFLAENRTKLPKTA